MAMKTAPSQGLSYGWVRGEDFWGGPVNDDLLYIDSTTFPIVESMTFTAPPDNVQPGQKFILPANPTGAWAGQDGKLAVYIEGAWVFYVPREGWRVRLRSLNAFIWFNGTTWEDERNGQDPTNPGTDPDVKPTYYDISVTVTDALYPNEALVHMPLLDALMLPANMNGAMLDMLAPATAYSQLTVQRNGRNVGAITVEAGASSASFSTIGGNAVLFAKNDKLTIRGQDPAVSAFKNFGFTIRLNYA